MTYSDVFLSKDVVETEELVLRVARAERAPDGARGRALARLAAPVGVGVALAGQTAFASASSGGAALVTKCVVLGLGISLGTLGAVEHFSSPVETAAVPVVARHGDASRAKALSEGQLLPMQRAGAPVELAGAAPTAAPLRAEPPHEPNEPAVAERSAPARGELASPSAARLTREVAALQVARASLARGEAQRALAALETYRAEFPVGELAAEAAALRVEATWAFGDRARALQLAESFLQAHPASPLGARIRSLLETANRAGTNRDRSPSAGQ